MKESINKSFCFMHSVTEAVRCYQCSSSHDPEGEDNCGAYERFDTKKNRPVECNSDESHMPGSFCVKVTKQGALGFVCECKICYIFAMDRFTTLYYRVLFSLQGTEDGVKWRGDVLPYQIPASPESVTGASRWTAYIGRSVTVPETRVTELRTSSLVSLWYPLLHY